MQYTKLEEEVQIKIRTLHQWWFERGKSGEEGKIRNVEELSYIAYKQVD